VSQASRLGIGAQEYADRMAQAGSLPALVAEVRRSKALAFVLEQATVTDASGRPVDLTALRRETEADGDAEGESGTDEPGAEAAEPAAGQLSGAEPAEPAAGQPTGAEAAEPAGGQPTGAETAVTDADAGVPPDAVAAAGSEAPARPASGS
jgi:trigger factor